MFSYHNTQYELYTQRNRQMINKRNNIITITSVLLMLGIGSLAQAAEPNPAELSSLINNFVKQSMEQVGKRMGVVLNLSGRQRMLTQKMSKEMLLIHLDIDAEKNRQNLGRSALLFNVTLNGLIKGDKSQNLAKTTDEDTVKQLLLISNLWHSFSEHILATLNKKLDKTRIQKVALENLPLLKEMNKAVFMYEKLAGADLAKMAPVVNLSGRQRMLTQKMSKEFLLIAAGISVKENTINLQGTIALFERTLKGLRDGDEGQRLPGTPQKDIRAQLDIIEKHWKTFRPILQKKDYSIAQSKHVASLNLPLLKEMDKAVKMYEVLSDE